MTKGDRTMNRQTYVGLNRLPLILQLNSGGEAVRWINYEKSAYYYAKDRVLWSMGTCDVLLRGGTNSVTGQQSILTMDTIVAVDSKMSPTKLQRYTSPPLNNKYLFKRDKYICAYCGHNYNKGQLTRDHIIPSAKGGPNKWENVVTACKSCNQWKADKTLKEAGLELLYVPYTPTYNEHLILSGRNILADQMEFLMKGVGKNSRLLS
jgi:5-methylcytosine-specific restriction endonuclease McrA